MEHLSGIKKGDQIDLILQLEPLRSPLKLRADVVGDHDLKALNLYTSQYEGSQHNQAGLGVKFIDLTEQNKEQLKMVLDHMLSQSSEHKFYAS